MNNMKGNLKSLKEENKKAYDEWEERISRKMKFWFSKEGKELQLCLISQGYEDRLMGILMVMFGSGFAALDIIKSYREVYLK